MVSNIKPALILILISMIIPEIITGSTSISGFLNPIQLMILFLGYGVAVLVVREIAVRNNLSIGGIFTLGFAFGLFNEGLLAKTLIRASELPMRQYDQYGQLFGISFPFTLSICLWHALASVLVPILIIYWLYPENKNQPWLNKKLTSVLFIILIYLSCAAFLGEQKMANGPAVQGSTLQLIIILGLMLGIYFIAKQFTLKSETKQTKTALNLKPLWLGISLFISYFVILNAIAAYKLPVFLFLAAFILMIWAYYTVLKKNNWLTQESLILFGIGIYLQNAFVSIIAAFTIPSTLIERLITGILLIIFLIGLAKKVKASKNS